MAREIPTRKGTLKRIPEFPCPFTEKAYKAYLEEERKLFDWMTETGGFVTFPVADGRAVYNIVKRKPLTVEHVPIGDAWQVPVYTIRGLQLRDVEAQERFKAMFKKGA